MEEIVLNGSSGVSDTVNQNNLCSSNKDSHESSEIHDAAVIDNHLTVNVLRNNKTDVEAAVSEETSEACPAEGVELVDSALLPPTSAAAEAKDADNIQTAAGDVNETNNDCRQRQMEQPSVNGTGSIEQSDKNTNLDAGSAAEVHGLELAMNQMKQKFSTFHKMNRPANVVIDLRSPPLVQVCLLHGVDDVGAGGSGSSRSSGVPWRPQTARRGRRRHSGTMDRIANADKSRFEGASMSCHPSHKELHSSIADVPSSQPVAKQSCGKDEESASEVSTIIHLKVIDSSGETVTSEQSKLSPVTDNAVSNSHIRRYRGDGDRNSESSEDGMMRVRNVNRTYSRNTFDPTARKNPRLITIAKSTDNHGNKQVSEASSDFSARTISRHAQEFKSVPKKSKKTGKRRPRIGPAWFSRRLLDAPPPEIWDSMRTSKALKMLKRANYTYGVRCRPIVANPPTVKQLLEVPVDEEADVATVGCEQLRLWRLSEDDVDELQSQLLHEAEHRRSEHIMPLVMQMTDDQIEHAYEHVAESMKTYEIVEADSDEDMEEEVESEEEVAENYENSSQLQWDHDDRDTGDKRSAETEYSRMRPKRHAVDYGPSAFTPILIMEGRRVFSQPRRSSKESHVKSADRAERVGTQRRSRSHKSRRRKTKKPNEQLNDMPVEISDTEDTAGVHCLL